MFSNLKPGPFLLIIILFFLLATFAIVKFSYPQENRNLDKRSNAVVWLVESGSQSLFAVAHRFVFFKFNLSEPTTTANEDRLLAEQIASSTDENISLPEKDPGDNLVNNDSVSDNSGSENLISDNIDSDSPVNNDQSDQSLEKINLTDNVCLLEDLNQSSTINKTENLESKKINWQNWKVISIFRINWRCLWQEYWQRHAGWLNN